MGPFDSLITKQVILFRKVQGGGEEINLERQFKKRLNSAAGKGWTKNVDQNN